jgi:hypothetical protein
VVVINDEVEEEEYYCEGDNEDDYESTDGNVDESLPEELRNRAIRGGFEDDEEEIDEVDL